MNIFVVGSGAREHALSWQLFSSTKVRKLYAAPGNAGIAMLAETAPILEKDIEGLCEFAVSKKIDLAVVGPDEPLALGIADALEARNIACFGPSRAAALIEASKAYGRSFCVEGRIPSPRSKFFGDYRQAISYIEQNPLPVVVKADGLARGKGVWVCRRSRAAEEALQRIFVEKVFPNCAGVVIEEYLEGQEASIHALSKGITSIFFPPSHDYKKLSRAPGAPNTGGMGAVAPYPVVTSEMLAEIKGNIVRPLLERLSSYHIPFEGMLYPGLMLTETGPKVLEFNVRFGDPETQCYMRLLATPLADILENWQHKCLDEIYVEWRDEFAVSVVLASRGYPEKPEIGKEIYGIRAAESVPSVTVFHAGTRREGKKFFTTGGRVLTVTATAPTLAEARALAYQAASRISFEGVQMRTDIGEDIFSHTTS